MADFSEAGGPFGFMFGDLMRALGSAHIDPSEIRRQFCMLALGDQGGQGIDLDHRERIEPLFDLAARQVQTSLVVSSLISPRVPNLSMVRPLEWAEVTFRDLSSYFDLLGQTLGGSMDVLGSLPELGDASDPSTGALMSQLASSLGPLLSNAQVGSLVGHWGLNAWSGYDLPLPRSSQDIMICPGTLIGAAEREGELADEIVLYWCAHELVTQALVRSPVLADRLDTEIRLYLLDVRSDTAKMLKSLTEGAMNDPSILEKLGSDPQMFLATEPSPAQEANLRELLVTLAVLDMATDLALDSDSGPLAGSQRWLSRVRDYRLEEPGRGAVAQVFGLNLASAEEAATRMIQDFASLGAERSDIADWVLRALTDGECMPHPEELSDVGSWIRRIAPPLTP